MHLSGAGGIARGRGDVDGNPLQLYNVASGWPEYGHGQGSDRACAVLDYSLHAEQ